MGPYSSFSDLSFDCLYMISSLAFFISRYSLYLALLAFNPGELIDGGILLIFFLYGSTLLDLSYSACTSIVL